MKYKLTKLFKDFNITGINFNSKKIRQGDAFFAIRGSAINGDDYINEAIKAGAKLILSDNEIYKNSGSTITYVENIRIALATACEIFYPNTPKNLIAVTGTNGKTSVASYCHQLFELLGSKSATIGTIGVQCSEKSILDKFNSDQFKSLTTADILTFRQLLNEFAKSDIENLTFEASSHGIDQHRLGSVKVQAAGFTSFSQDHLDYHLTMKHYLDTKLRLFSEHLQENALAVLNSEIDEIDYIKNFLISNKIRYITVGSMGDVNVDSVNQAINSQEIIITHKDKNYNFKTDIIGRFQATNLTIAAMLVAEFDFPIQEIINKISLLKPVKGRLERVTEPGDHYQIFVDYSHTPDSLKRALQELRVVSACAGRLVVVFGCGGNRDTSKRAIMGRVADKLADIKIVTDDNPRYENAADIRKQILSSMVDAFEIGDRKEAITYAINILKKDDILLIAGKGHENYQIIGDNITPFDDAMIAKEILGYKK